MSEKKDIPPIIVAIDRNSQDSALALVDQLDPQLCRVKVGKELFTRCGPQIIHELHRRNFEIFLDLKFHDIPNTVAQAVLAAADLGVFMVNVHASSGSEAMKLSKSRLVDNGYDTLLIAVTVLTSMSIECLHEVGVNASVKDQVKRLALLAQNSGMDGVVCSAQEASMLKQLCGQKFQLVTPGIRLDDDDSDDQRRICNPKQALMQGADYLVIGRSITQASNPNNKLKQIIESIA